MRLCLTMLFAMAGWAANTKVDFDPTNPEIGPFPTDYLTTPDARQRTGRRVNLPLPDCGLRASDCGEIALINQLDGFSQNARLTLRFTAPIQPETLRDNVYIAWLDPAPNRLPVYPAGKLSPVNELVYDPATQTAFVKPDEILESGRQYLILVTDGVRDVNGDGVEAHEGYSACLAERIGGDYCRNLKEALARITVPGRRIAGARLVYDAIEHGVSRRRAAHGAIDADGLSPDGAGLQCGGDRRHCVSPAGADQWQSLHG